MQASQCGPLLKERQKAVLQLETAVKEIIGSVQASERKCAQLARQAQKEKAERRSILQKETDIQRQVNGKGICIQVFELHFDSVQ